MTKKILSNMYDAPKAHEQRMQEAITAKTIASLMRSIKVGDEIRIPTLKSCSDERGNSLTYVERKAVVIGVYPAFIHARLENGICESISWFDYLKTRRTDGEK